MDQIALLAFIGQDYQHDSITDHLAVSFIKGYVVLTWNLGSGGYFCFNCEIMLHFSTYFQLYLFVFFNCIWNIYNFSFVLMINPGYFFILKFFVFFFRVVYFSEQMLGLIKIIPQSKEYRTQLVDSNKRALHPR